MEASTGLFLRFAHLCVGVVVNHPVLFDSTRLPTFPPRHSALTLDSFGHEAFSGLATPGFCVEGVFSKHLAACKHFVTASTAHVSHFHDGLSCNPSVCNSFCLFGFMFSCIYIYILICIYIYVFVFICVYIHMYIYIYIERERDTCAYMIIFVMREKERERVNICIHTHIPPALPYVSPVRAEKEHGV